MRAVGPRAEMPEPGRERERGGIAGEPLIWSLPRLAGGGRVGGGQRISAAKANRPNQGIGAWMWVSRSGQMDVVDMDLAGVVSVFTWSSVSRWPDGAQ